MLDALLLRIEALPLAKAIARATWAYPILEVIHLGGIAALFGSLLTLELQILKPRRKVPLQALAPLALRITLAGFVVAVASGVLLFISRASEMGTNPAFLFKLALIAAAGANALWFHRRQGLVRDDATTRLQAIASLMLWFGAIAAGRLIAYV